MAKIIWIKTEERPVMDCFGGFRNLSGIDLAKKLRTAFSNAVTVWNSVSADVWSARRLRSMRTLLSPGMTSTTLEKGGETQWCVVFQKYVASVSRSPECPWFPLPRVEGTEAQFCNSFSSTSLRTGKESVSRGSMNGCGKLWATALSDKDMINFC